MEKKVVFFSTRSSLPFAEAIAYHYGTVLGQINFLEFSDGEYKPTIEQSVRGAIVFLIGSTFQPADNLMELLLMCDAARRSSAKNINLVIPYFGWSRQDRTNNYREPISASLVAKLIIAAGANRVLTMDLHSDQIQGLFDITVDQLNAYSIFIDYILTLGLDKLIIASPDIGGAKRAMIYARYLKTDMVVCYKERQKANKVEFMKILGNVKGKNVIIIDDIIDTADTIFLAADIMKKEGANSLRAIATHPLFSADVAYNISRSNLEEIIVTDTIYLKYPYRDKIKVLSSAPLFAEVMHLVIKTCL